MSARFGEEQPQRALIGYRLSGTVVLDFGFNVRPGRQSPGGFFGETHETIPGRPASEPLPGLLNRKYRGMNHAPVAWHILQSADLAFGGQACVDNEVLRNIAFAGLDYLSR